MKRTIGLALGALAVGASLLTAHDLFIRLESYFVEPHSRITIPVLNGSFTESENWISRDRVVDISIVSRAGRVRMDTANWSPNDDSTTTLLTVEAGDAGTYLIGASTRPRELDLTAQDFNEYLEHDGIPDVLAARRRAGELDKPVRERYAKHVKAVFQVGEARTGPFDTPLGYPAEIVPLVNPYAVDVGDRVRVQCLVGGDPIANQLVIVGGEAAGGSFTERSFRTDAKGMVTFRVDAAGLWYVKFISMTPASDPGLDYVSQWATLTFAVR